MRQCDIIRFLFQDLKEATAKLVMGEYHSLFEDEIQEHYPFGEEIQKWLEELYGSEKYNELEGVDRSILFEKSHPFLFVRDLATINNWRAGFRNDERRDQITGLLFSMTPSVALEATIALCQPTQTADPVSQWFDTKQAMVNLEAEPSDDNTVEAWRGCAYFYLYMFFTSKDQPPAFDELQQMLSPFREAIDFGLWNGELDLRKQCRIVDKALTPKKFRTMVDSVL